MRHVIGIRPIAFRLHYFEINRCRMFSFLLKAVAISLSGVMGPGPITAASLAAGGRFRHAGAFIALGHAVVELPLILLLAAGVGTFLKSPAVKAGIGLAGGAVLVLMGAQLLLSLPKKAAEQVAAARRRPFITGIVLTGANPYFLLWWATVGLALATQAAGYGALALVVFGIVHWLCDLVWLEVLSYAGFQGSRAFGLRSQKVIALVCGLALLGFGLDFLYDAGASLF
jgi:threonine/homoserine/homoserine lactone efflux protein